MQLKLDGARLIDMVSWLQRWGLQVKFASGGKRVARVLNVLGEIFEFSKLVFLYRHLPMYIYAQLCSFKKIVVVRVVSPKWCKAINKQFKLFGKELVKHHMSVGTSPTSMRPLGQVNKAWAKTKEFGLDQCGQYHTSEVKSWTRGVIRVWTQLEVC